MKKLRLVFLLVVLAIVFNACSTSEVKEEEEYIPEDALLRQVNTLPRLIVFGRYVNRCEGKECVEIYRFDGENLFEDVLNRKPILNTQFEGKFTHNVRHTTRLNLFSLLDNFPVKEFNSRKTHVIGNPGANDGLIYYLEVHDENKNIGYWIISSDKNELTKVMSAYIDLLDSIITVLEREDQTY